eukprot:2153195-Pleurochrysis_carterae.AAC.1
MSSSPHRCTHAPRVHFPGLRHVGVHQAASRFYPHARHNSQNARPGAGLCDARFLGSDRSISTSTSCPPPCVPDPPPCVPNPHIAFCPASARGPRCV